ncbi:MULTISPECIES: hypothetical protein [unclassified Microbispora]|uniref:hypothetical protein n=1 Tax=Microbispora sp. CL1-1 TaxID=2720026 RepID=UPI00197BB044|nr:MULTISPECIES: hypothetical protein [unclassified Microbispora]
MDPLERLDVHDRLVDNLFGPDPLARRVPLELGGVALGDIVDVQEFFLLALLVPDLATGIARVEEDGLDRRLRPGDPAAMAVSGPVVGGGARNALAGEPLGDQVEALAVEELPEDPAHDGSCGRVGLQSA